MGLAIARQAEGQKEYMSNTTQRPDGSSVTFAEHFIHTDGLRMRYLEAGHGSPVVVLHTAEGLQQSELHTLLARQFRVIAFEIPGVGLPPHDVARTLTQASLAVGLEQYVLVSSAANASIALWQAIDTPEQGDGLVGLVLISPTVLLPEGRIAASGFARDPELERRLADLQVATLVLVGTNDEILPAETGPRYVEHIPHCYYVLVYDAGHAIETDRPDALCTAVGDFVERRDAFIVEQNNTAINP